MCVYPNVIKSRKRHLKQFLDVSNFQVTELTPSFLNIFVAILKILSFFLGFWIDGFFLHSLPVVEFITWSIYFGLVLFHELYRYKNTISS